MAARWLGAVIFGALAVTGCGSDTDSEAGSGSESTTVLSQASPYVTTESGSVQFTDWTAVKAAFGGDDLSSESSESEQRQFYETVAKEAAIGPAYLSLGDDLVGFGALDLEWEARTFGEDRIVNVLGFPGGFDFDSAESALSDCGYEESAVDGGTLFEKAPTELCAGEEPFSSIPDPSLAAIAVLPDAGVAVTSSGADAVTAAIEGDGAPLEAVAEDLGAQLDGALAGYVDFGETACDAVSGAGANASPEQLEAIEKEIGDLGEPYEIFLATYVDEGDAMTGRFVLDFASSGDAESQLKARSDAFENAKSLVSGQPYSDIYSLDSAEVAEDAIVFEASSVEGPNPLLQSVVQRDLPFAAC